MQPGVELVDPVARLIAFIGLGIASIVGLLHLLTYLRGRRQNPKIRVRVPTRDAFIIVKPHLLVIKLFIDNQSILRNTLIDMSCFIRQDWFHSTQLEIGPPTPIFVSTAKVGESKSAMRLTIAPTVILDEMDWKLLIAPMGVLPKEAIWDMPLTISALDSRLIYVAIASERVELKDEAKLTLVFHDVTDKCHRCSINLKAALLAWKQYQAE